MDWKAGIVRAGWYLIALAGLGVLAAGCGTVHVGPSAPQDTLVSAVSNTTAQTARIAITEAMQSSSMSMSFTQTGEFDFADSRGTITMAAPVGMTELFLPPTIYIKVPGLQKGKTWIAVDAAGWGAMSGMVGSFGIVGDPSDMLESLTAIAGSERVLGKSSVRGVPVTEYQVNIDPAKMAAKASGAAGASLSQFAKSYGSGSIPVDVWVDHQNLVRRLRLRLQVAGQSGASTTGGKMAMVLSVDFSDFGVPVQVSAPPAAQVDILSGKSSFAVAGIGSASPVPVGSLVPGATGSAASAAPAQPTEISSPIPVPTMISSPLP